MKKVFLILLLLIVKQHGFSCNCIGKATVNTAYKESDIVVVAQMMIAKQILIRRDTGNIHAIYADYRKENKDTLPYNAFVISFMKEKQMIEYTFVTIKNFKGSSISDTLNLLSPFYSSDCGIRVTSENDYLIYAEKMHERYVYISHLGTEAGYLSKEILFTNKCSRTTIFNEELEDISILEKLK